MKGPTADQAGPPGPPLPAGGATQQATSALAPAAPIALHAREQLGEEGVREYSIAQADGLSGSLIECVARLGAFRPSDRTWCLHAAELAQLRAVPNVHVSVEPLTQIADHAASYAARREASREPVDELLSLLPYSAVGRLKAFQYEGVRFALRAGGRCLIADEMGLGKTIQAIMVMGCYREDWPALIIAPKSVTGSWREEVLRWLPEHVIPPSQIHVVLSARDGLRSDASMTIISYKLAEQLGDALLRERYGVLVADESHHLKTRDAKRTKAITKLASAARRVILLSGTPAMSRPVELFPQLHMIQPRIFSSFNAFTDRYCDAKVGRFGRDTSGRSNLAELNRVLTTTVMIRRLKDSVDMEALPQKTRRVVWLEADGPQAAGELAKAKAAVDAVSAVSRLTRDSTELTRFYTVTGEVKVGPVLAYLASQLGCSTRKAILFAHHRRVLDDICGALEARGSSFMRIDGQTPAAERVERVRRFQESPAVTFAVLGITAAGAGITLHTASIVVFCELTWNASDLQQAEDRAHRIGQTSPVQVIYLLLRGSVDELVWPTVNRKLDVVARTLDGAGKAMNEYVASKDVSIEPAVAPNSTKPPSTLPALFAKEAALPKFGATERPGQISAPQAAAASSAVMDAAKDDDDSSDSAGVAPVGRFTPAKRRRLSVVA